MRLGIKALAILSLAASLLSGADPAQAYTQTVRYSACPSGACAGTAFDSVMKRNSALYGTGSGGTHNGGVVWRYGTNTGVYEVLYNFCTNTIFGLCTDGNQPVGPLIIDTSGNLYGVTAQGGSHAAGTVFELVKPATAHGAWTLVTLYNFCSASGCSDGADPQAGLNYAGASSGTAYDGTSLLYGTTQGGGNSDGDGVAFVLKNNSGIWSEKVIHTFCTGCSTSCTVCSDGISPLGQFVLDSSGDILGTAFNGGSKGLGAAYELVPTGDPWADPWTESVIHNFCHSMPMGNCFGGSFPNGLIQDASSGDLYGTTTAGGVGGGGVNNGMLFRLYNPGGCTEGGTGPFWCEDILHAFCALSACADGAVPSGQIDMDTSGNIYGTTRIGGDHSQVSGGAGVAWMYNGSTASVIHAFCSASTCPDGKTPNGIIWTGTSFLYGVTLGGGTGTPPSGTIYDLSP